MVSRLRVDFDSNNNSPRIRGDGPHSAVESSIWNRFSPYSRGWSRLTPPQALCPSILPVFAGMVPRRKHVSYPAADSPRIRGDGPQDDSHIHVWKVFSPYSRGWSRKYREVRSIFAILPVFAGMVPDTYLRRQVSIDSPRIRGDGPAVEQWLDLVQAFSPYSRGWSSVPQCIHPSRIILPVFAGMVPH